MPKQTPNLKLGYLVAGEALDPTTEATRFQTIDAQLSGLFAIMGDGVVDGWNLAVNTEDPTLIDVSSGTGIINKIACSTTISTQLGPIPSGLTMYVFAKLRSDSYWSQNVDFVLYESDTDVDNHVLLGSITADANGEISSFDESLRRDVGLLESLKEYLKNHRHIGGEDNPDPIDLASDVQGTIKQENLPEIDASVIATGKLDPARFANINHISQLENQGSLTHAQLDTFVSQMSNTLSSSMGESAVVNFMQLVLALKHQWPEVDEYLVNLLAFVPGISPNSFIDTDNTTATVDTATALEGGTHTITGTAGTTAEVFTKAWSTDEDFALATSSLVSTSNDSVRLSTTETQATIEDFESVGDWLAKIRSISSGGEYLSFQESGDVVYSGSYSGKLDYNTSTALTFSYSLVLEKTFTPQDWSEYDKLVMFINTAGTSHGDLYLYVKDSSAGVQNSYTLILNRNEPTINRDTLLNGWREVWLDLSSLTRTSITSIGIYTSTDMGWDVVSPFSINIDNTYITTGNRYQDSGYVRVTYGNGVPQKFTSVRWDTTVPDGTVFKVRTRMANSESDFSSPTPPAWSSYSLSSGFSIYNPGDLLYGYIQIECYFESDTNNTSSPCLNVLYLDREISSDEKVFSFDSKDEWDTGTLVNIDTNTTPGSIAIASTADINTYLYASGGSITKRDSAFTNILSVAGEMMPKSFQQSIDDLPAEFGTITAVRKGPNNSFFVCDPENDRVVQIDSSGNLLYGLYGTLLDTPIDPYGNEDKGQGEGTDTVDVPADESADESSSGSVNSDSSAANPINAVMAIYNPNSGMISIAFDRNIKPPYLDGAINPTGFLLKCNAFRTYIGESATFSGLGIDAEKHAGWLGVSKATNTYIDQFSFATNVLQITLPEVDRDSLNAIVGFTVPAISVSSPNEHFISTSASLSATVAVTNWTLSVGSGKIRYQWDNEAMGYTYSTTIVKTGLSEGRHSLRVWLADSYGNVLANEEAMAETFFIVDTDSSITDPVIEITSPTDNQFTTESSINIAFTSHNHPIVISGTHLEYALDGETWNDHWTEDPINLTGLSGGKHTFVARLVDNSNVPIDSTMAVATVTFFVGQTSVGTLSIYIERAAVMSDVGDEDMAVEETNLPVNIGNLYFSNLFCPVDIQYLTDVSAAAEKESILIAKMRSPSWTTDMGAPPDPLNVVASSSDPKSIFGSPFMSGYSVVEHSIADGSIVFANNAATFTDSKANALRYLGSADKISNEELLLADGIKNRAIISVTSDGQAQVMWEYTSDRIVSDFHMVKQEAPIVSVETAAVAPSSLNIRAGTTIYFENDSAAPITVYSGNTTKATFDLDPDTELYGSDFETDELQPGDTYALTINTPGTYGWFAYPNILTGTIVVHNQRISNEDNYIITERDPDYPLFGNRIVKVNAWGDIVWSFGNGYLYDPKDATPLLDGSVIIST